MKSIWTKQSLSPIWWFWISLFCFLPLHVSAVVLDVWFSLPPKPIGDGPDYEAIGYGLSQGQGWSTSYSDPRWRAVYKDPQISNALDYSVQLARVGPVLADTNRPPLFPFCIGVLYQCLPRGPIAFGAIRIGLACCLSLGCALAVAWGVALAVNVSKSLPVYFPNMVAAALIAIVYSERNLRNYTTDFLTEPPSLLLTQMFLVVSWCGVRKKSWQLAVSSGALFAGMYLCRGVFVLWTPLVFLWLWYLLRVTNPAECAVQPGFAQLSPARWILVCMMAFVSIASVWWIRNCSVLESFHPLGTKGATTLMGGYCDEAFEAGGEWRYGPEKALRIQLESSINAAAATATDFRNLELRMGALATVKVNHWVASNWQLLPTLVLKRVVTEWNPYVGKALVLKLLALFGAYWLLRNDPIALIWLLGPLVINTIVVGATYSVGGRFLVPTYGSLYILAAFGLSSFLTIILGRINRA